MAKRNHEWIEQYQIYEAVLCCSHDLRAWDRDETLRAYQTWGFDDATTNGNELSFQHIDTGVMILHDGGVVAIQYGGGDMVSALADLFTTLEALGWHKAEVYHPQETLDALLADMGKAIPAHLDFDVLPAKDFNSSVENSDEANQMVELGVNLLQGVASNPAEAQQFNQVALAELQSMTAESQIEQSFQAPAPEPESGSIEMDLQLEDGFENYGDSSGNHYAAPSIAPVRQTERIAFSDDEDALPIVPVLSTTTAETVEVEPVSTPLTFEEDATLHHEPSPFTETVSEHDDSAVTITPQLAVDTPAVTEVEPLGAPLNELPKVTTVEPLRMPDMMGGQNQEAVSTSSQHAAVMYSAVHQTLVPQFCKVMKLGSSAICFDLPEAGIDQVRIEALCDELKIREVVDVWPGLTKQPVRWNLLGEIDPASPWFAEAIADGLHILKPVERILFAGALTHAASEGIQIRALLLKLLDGIWAADALVKATQSSVDCAGLTQAVFSKLGALLLSGEGEAFLDTVSASGESSEEKYPPTLEVFSARSISQDAVAKLYVVHLDACDGPFVQTVVSLLMEVAQRYSNSSRNIKLAEAQRNRAMVLEQKAQEERRKESQRIEAAKKAQEAFSLMLNQMKEAGLDVSTMKAMIEAT